jgi:hypothetical protein
MQNAYNPKPTHNVWYDYKVWDSSLRGSVPPSSEHPNPPILCYLVFP